LFISAVFGVKIYLSQKFLL